MVEIDARIAKIENGWTVYSSTKTKYFDKIEDALEHIKKILR